MEWFCMVILVKYVTKYCMFFTGWSTVHGCTHWRSLLPSSAITSSMWCYWFFRYSTFTGLLLLKLIFSKVCLQVLLFMYVKERNENAAHFSNVSQESWDCPYLNVSLWHISVLQLEGDDRSDEEEDDSDSPKERNNTLSHINGSGARGRRANGHWHIYWQKEMDKKGNEQQKTYSVCSSWNRMALQKRVNTLKQK